MKKIISLFLISALILSSCSSVKKYSSNAIDKTADALGVGDASGIIKKAVIAKEQKWDDGDYVLENDIIYSLQSSQKYLQNLLKKLQNYSDYKKYLGIYMLRTARAQGLAYWGADIRITRGMFNMIYDEAELACLIGHEIGHNALNHLDNRFETANKASNAASNVTDILLPDSKYSEIIKRQQKALIKTGWSRNQEKEADKYGAELAAKAGYDPYAFCDLFERLAERIDLDFVYRFKKLEGSHPALDDRAKTLRKYLQEKGYKEGEGARNRQEYIEGLSELFAMRSGEGKQEDEKIQKEIDEEGSKDLKRLDEIFKELSDIENAKKTISIARFFEIMEEVSSVCQKYGVKAEDVFGFSSGSDDSFMEESIIQDSPFWEIYKGIKDGVKEKVSGILGMLGRIAIGSLPVIGDVIDVYELISGKDFFSGEKLTALEKTLTAFGLLIGSGSQWRALARGIENEITNLSGRLAAKNIDEARAALKSAIKDVEVSDNWKKIYSKTANKGYESDKLPYRKNMSAYEGVLKNDEIFYRAHLDNNQNGSWLIRFNPENMTAEELQNLFSLPVRPKYISKVKVPAGTNIRVGNAAEIENWGKGGAVQWEIRTNDGSAISNDAKIKSKQLKEIGLIFEVIKNL
ncbi:MAG: M48 family metalloprotease [Endomicrobium sp.]|jgi:Zn-dependent protease with chaperone function|nr:M48 family metalloprotease [Endomicrobium sp.]